MVPNETAIPVQPAWLTDKQVAAWLSCHKSTVWDLARTEKLPRPHKFTNGMSRWSWDELQRWKNEKVVA